MSHGFVLTVIFGVGFVMAIVLYILRTKFSYLWFINVPAFYVGMQVVNYFWFSAILALLLKYLLIKTLGVKKYEEYVLPVIAGVSLSFGFFWGILAVYDLIDVALPIAQKLYIP